MKNTTITFFCLRPEEKSYLEKLFSKDGISASVEYHSEIISPDNLPAKNDAEVLSVFVDSIVNGPVLNMFPKLKFIAARATGYDNIDLTETAKRGIIVSNVPSYGENTVAEFTFGLILSLSRKIYIAANQVKATGSFNLEKLRGFDIQGKTIGVVGTGRIGRHVIAAAKSFGMNVICYDPFPNDKFAQELAFKYVSLDELLNLSDIITLHLPYTKETHHLINDAALSKMKKNAILVNTSRGGIVDTNALVKALSEKQIAGAGLDVIEEEGAIKDELNLLSGGHPEEHNLRTILEDHALMKMSNVIVTPHIAFNTEEALERILDMTVENIKHWMEGKPQNVVK